MDKDKDKDKEKKHKKSDGKKDEKKQSSHSKLLSLLKIKNLKNRITKKRPKS